MTFQRSGVFAPPQWPTAELLDTTNPIASAKPTIKKPLLQKLGPGLITGAADDDPSGIATYSQVGAMFGYSMMWLMLLSYPLMIAIQEICARIGRVTGVGIAANMRKHYPAPMLYAIVSLLCVANVFNLGADIGAMGAAAQLLLGGSLIPYTVGFSAVSLLLQMYVRYTRYVAYLKWLTMALFAYVLTAFVANVSWGQALHATFVPSLTFNAKYFTALIAVLGTTISPYLFFWQASEEAEEVRDNRKEHPLKWAPWQARKQFQRIRVDTVVGMGFSNLVSLFIILTTAATLHTAGITDIQTSAQAAKALEPLAGRFAFALFALGIIGTGLLSVPVLAGAAAYGVAEAFRWPASLERQPREARGFYGVLAAATLIGLALNFVGLNPIRALVWSAVINGVVSVPLMVVTMRLAVHPKVMGQFTLPLRLRVVGWIATVVMMVASIGLFATLGW
jgi:NRAMP (natural resistance-associated macrophage protein)-like metal ion transporter